MTPDFRIPVKGAYVGVVHGVGFLLTRAGLLHDQPPPIEHRWRHWAYSLTKVHDSLALARMGVPWWTYRGIAVVDAWLAARPRPVRVFEYGSGASTLWLADRADEVHSVEHHVAFGEMIGKVLSHRENVTFHVVPSVPTDSPRIESAKEGYRGQDFSAYVSAIDEVGGDFDLIVIDGRAREAGLDAALKHLAGDGIIVLDNSLRRRYRRAIAASGLAEQRLPGLTPTLPYPDQTSILSGPSTGSTRDR